MLLLSVEKLGRYFGKTFCLHLPKQKPPFGERKVTQLRRAEKAGEIFLEPQIFLGVSLLEMAVKHEYRGLSSDQTHCVG